MEPADEVILHAVILFNATKMIIVARIKIIFLHHHLKNYLIFQLHSKILTITTPIKVHLHQIIVTSYQLSKVNLKKP